MTRLEHRPIDTTERARIDRLIRLDQFDRVLYAVVRAYDSCGICEDREWYCHDDADVVRTVAYYRLPHESMTVFYGVRSGGLGVSHYSERVRIVKAGQDIPSEFFEGVAA